MGASKTVEDLQGLTGDGKPPPEGWGGGLKSDSRTIEQKLDAPRIKPEETEI